MNDNFGRMICNGTLIDLNKSTNEELQKIIDDLEQQERVKKNKLINILNKMSEEK